MKNATFDALLVADSETFFAAAHEMAAAVKRTKGNYGTWQLHFNGSILDVCRSEDRKSWELWSLAGDNVSREIKTIKAAKCEMVWNARNEAQDEARLAAFDAANPEIEY